VSRGDRNHSQAVNKIEKKFKKPLDKLKKSAIISNVRGNPQE
jgi:hypothetical protein